MRANDRRIGIGIGTPGRLVDLFNAGRNRYARNVKLITDSSGALSSKELKRVVVDSSWIDQKKRNIFDMKETHEPLVCLLTRSELKERYGSRDDQIQLLFF